MKTLAQLFENNRRWVAQITAKDPQFFERLSHQQTPKYLWIGCSDSRVPANQITGLLPGEVFVHRNISNVVSQDDPNCLSVVEYAVEVLHVEHIIVCGHFGCGGVEAAMENRSLGLSDQWLQHVKDVRDKHAAQLSLMPKSDRLSRLCELNVIEQVLHVTETSIVQSAWKRQQPLSIHGWIYAISDGLLRDLDVCITNPQEVATLYSSAVQNVIRLRA